MKRRLFTIVLVAGFTAGTALAQMGGGDEHGGMMHGQQSQMMSGQMTKLDMTRDMSAMMKQMHQTVGKMSQLMEAKTDMDHANMIKMSQAMTDMSMQMQDMAEQMKKGTMDADTMNKMHVKLMQINQTLDSIQK